MKNLILTNLLLAIENNSGENELFPANNRRKHEIKDSKNIIFEIIFQLNYIIRELTKKNWPADDVSYEIKFCVKLKVLLELIS